MPMQNLWQLVSTVYDERLSLNLKTGTRHHSKIKEIVVLRRQSCGKVGGRISMASRSRLQSLFIFVPGRLWCCLPAAAAAGRLVVSLFVLVRVFWRSVAACAPDPSVVPLPVVMPIPMVVVPPPMTVPYPMVPYPVVPDPMVPDPMVPNAMAPHVMPHKVVPHHNVMSDPVVHVVLAVLNDLGGLDRFLRLGCLRRRGHFHRVGI